jgi:hypothetical protein
MIVFFVDVFLALPLACCGLARFNPHLAGKISALQWPARHPSVFGVDIFKAKKTP